MPQCPQCTKPLLELTRQCPSCRADLDLLVDYVNGLQSSLDRAEQLIRTGELGAAVWAYLEVLEIDPDNTTAKHQVSRVATAVRQFDRTVPGRRWAQGLPQGNAEDSQSLSGWVKGVLAVVVVLVAFGLGFLCGQGVATDEGTPLDPNKELPKLRQDNLMGK